MTSVTPLLLPDIEKFLEACAKQHAAGDKSSLIDALHCCMTFGVPIPEWAAKAFCTGVRRARAEYKHSSWDDVFGKPIREGSKLVYLRQQSKLRGEVVRRVHSLRRQKPKPRDIFRKVADQLGIAPATAKRYFHKHEETERRTQQWRAKMIANRQIPLGQPDRFELYIEDDIP